MNIQKKNSRRYAEPGPKLYTVELQRGLALGYRRSALAGSWTARRFIAGTKYQFQVLGLADDAVQADGVTVLTFDQAADKAREWAKQKALADAGEIIPGAYSVSECLDDYLADLKMRKDGDHSQTVSTIEAKLKPQLGAHQLTKLTRKHIEDWFHGLVTSGNSKSTANRNLTVLCAALNVAYRNNRIATKAVWDKIKKFKGVDKARARFLTIEQCKNLIEVCPGDFQKLLRASLYTGCRYGELTALLTEAFNPAGGTVHIAKSKSGKPRTIALTSEGVEFFKSITAGKDATELIFTHTVGRKKGQAWQRTQQTFHMKHACKLAKITPPCGFHVARHSYASHLKMKGTDSFVIARQLGHRDTRMVELHYGHLEDSYIASEIRSRLPDLGYRASGAVKPGRRSTKRTKGQ